MAEVVRERSVLQDHRIQASLRRLRAMGLAVYASTVDDNRAVILVDIESILRYIVRKIDQATSYPNKRIVVDRVNNVIRMEVWRGE